MRCDETAGGQHGNVERGAMADDVSRGQTIICNFPLYEKSNRFLFGADGFGCPSCRVATVSHGIT